MKRYQAAGFSLVVSFAFVLGIWQIAETQLANAWGFVCYKLSGHSFREVNTRDKQGIPMRYIPGAGKVYEPQFVAAEASRYYNTRIDPERLQGFMDFSEWLLAHIDSTGLIPQNYDYAVAGYKAPWYKVSTQSSAMVALAKRAGHLRDQRTFTKARRMLNKLDEMALPEGTEGIWFEDYPGKELSLRGMLITMANLGEYHKLVGDTLASRLYKQGAIALQAKLPQIQQKGFLQDKYLAGNLRSKHKELVNLLEQASSASRDSLFQQDVNRLRAVDKKLVLSQMVQRPSLGRILGFFVGWMLFAALAYWLIRPVHHDTELEP